MGYLKTVLTYHQPSEAEVDKAYLESEGITVCLLNANTCRNELGPAFYVQLQVPDHEYQQAVTLLRDANPQRFGSAERVAEIEKQMISAVAWFAAPAIVFGPIGFFWASDDQLRVPIAVSCAGLAGFISLIVRKFRRKKDA